MENEAPAIRTESLTKRFGTVTAVDGLNISIRHGELFGLVGSDGAGKTTTLRLMAGIMDPTEGRVWMLGHDVPRDAEKVRPEIGYMSQRFGLYPDLTVMENLEFYADIHSIRGKERSATFSRLLSFSNLEPFRTRKAGHLSGGMKQKLGLACALVHTPRVLLLDEPTNGVDPVSRRDFWRILYQLLRQGVTIVVSTAYLDEADRCHRVGMIHQGRLLACDTPEGLRGLMRGQILEIRTAEPRKAANLLKEKLPDTEVGLFGERIHLVSADPGTAAKAAASILEAEGLPVTQAVQVEPDLEDVFVSVLGEVP